MTTQKQKEELEERALAEYKKIRDTAYAEYEKVRYPAWAEYKKKLKEIEAME